MVARERALLDRFFDRCTIMHTVQSVNPSNGRTESAEEVLFDNVPCRLSFKTSSARTVPSAGDGDVSELHLDAKLMLSVDYDVAAGSSITVRRGTRIFYFERSGSPAVFTYHQEIGLKLAAPNYA